MLKVATWNINGVKARQDALLGWLAEASPDIACLQEIKSLDEAFPREPLEALGYNVETHGQKGFNGVAILSKRPLEDVTPRLAGDDADEQARFLEAVVSTREGVLRVASAYMPNGNPVGGEKFDYKLAWLERLQDWVKDRLALEEPFVLAGDFNIIPGPLDARFPERWTDDALFQPQSRRAWRRLLAAGLTDAVRCVSDAPDLYSFWDYQAGAWQKNNGIRIDHLLLSPEAADRLAGAGIDKHVRAWEKPSDHVPVWAALQLS
ncbi:exodeoxyribonuclease III [Afifella pfennigii]|uniref:exodeoxyribonuclease III n=1 Tax=Afifella pfennigii TaxID=209897 RepID=UPI000A036D31|nr:exodeoxyribonuclease III [Afifella pfennigii]